MQFKNPENDYIEERSVPWLWAFLFGGLYFIACGLWAPLFIWAIIIVPLYVLMGPPATILAFFIGIVCAVIAPGLVRNSYLRKGWIELVDSVPSTQFPASTSSPPSPLSSTAQYRQCPFCAEKIRFEAIKCKHCGSMLTALDAPSSIPAP